MLRTEYQLRFSCGTHRRGYCTVNAPTKQRQSRNFKSLNIITSTKFETWLATSYSEVTINVQTAASLLGHTPGDVFSICRLLHRQRSATGQTRPRSGAASVDPHLSPASAIHDAVHGSKCSSCQGWGRGCWPASCQAKAGWTLVFHDAETQPSHVPAEWRRFWVKGQQFEHLW